MRKNRAHKKLAEYIALKYQQDTTPLEEIINEEELAVYYEDYGNGSFDGATMFENGHFSIHLNTRRGNKYGSPRGRFTLAHELGHYFIDSHRVGLKEGILKAHPSYTNQAQFYTIEKEADYFASCLLMPEIRFTQEITKQIFSMNLIDELRNKFHVSRIACLLRYADIGNHPIKIVYAENKMVKWTYNSKDFPYWKLIYDKQLPKNSVIGEYFNDVKYVDTYREEEIWAVDCFAEVSEEDSDRVFYEYCITHKNCALSVFWED